MQTSRFVLEADAASPRVARERFRAELAGWGTAESRDRAVLLVSELVTNAVVHARTPITVRLELAPGCASVEVSDDSERLPEPRMPRADRPGGRGLHLLEELTDGWGVRPGRVGKTVWFELNSDPGE
jgi:anti-sigma regulatory factor (Ser/Thr protein kinase)